jgi:parvulin-like peptidyl-prolyl isomerase
VQTSRAQQLALLVAVAGLVTVALAATAHAGERMVVEGIVARVNDRIVTLTDFQERLREELAQRPQELTAEERERFIDGLLSSIVEELVLLERAEEKRLTVDEDEVDRSIAGLREQNKLEGDAEFEAALQQSGMTVDALRERYRQMMLLQRVVQSEVRALELPAEEIRRAYERDKERFAVPAKVRLEQLYVPVGEGEDPTVVESRVVGLIERVREGSDLTAEATLAGVSVEDLGAIPLEDLRPELRGQLEAMEPGEISAPIATAGGFQVLILKERIPPGYQPFEQVREQLRREISQERYQEQTQGLVERLKSDYLVEMHPELIDQAWDGGDLGE